MHKIKGIAVAFLVYLSVLIFNDGFMALDEYWVGVVRYIPAQTSTIQTLVGPDDVKSPLQLMPMYYASQAALGLGINSPYWQYRFVIIVIGLLSVMVSLYSLRKFSIADGLEQKKTDILFLMFGFYFAAPFSLTRPMFEAIAAPWLLLSAVYAFKYDKLGRLKDLLWGVFFVSIAFCLRQQLGFCALTFVVLVVLKKNLKHFLWMSLTGLFFLIISGIPDYYLRGQFHFSLLNLTVYNFKHGSEYGDQSILFYPAMIFVLALIPFFIAKYSSAFLKEQLTRYRVFYLYILLFVFLHSLFPNKWERFLISLLPFFVVVLFPFFNYFLENKEKYRFRLMFLAWFNFFLFIIASYFPAQKNLIEMSRYLNSNPHIKKVYRISNTPEWITEAFILNKKFEFIESTAAELQNVDFSDCSNVLVVGEAQYKDVVTVTEKLKQIAEFNVNLIEQLAFRFNPDKNLRRVQLRLFSSCGAIK